MKKLAKIVAIANQKGGVGKTTSVVNISTAISAIGNKVLLIDLDPQGNASTSLGIEQRDRERSSYEVLIGEVDVSSAIRKTFLPNLDVLPAKMELAAAEIELASLADKERILKKILHEVGNGYDFVFIDCPPSLGLLTINSLVAADYLIVPLQCEFLALEGLVHLMNTCSLIKRSLNKNLSIIGILLTMLDRRNKLSLMVEQDVRKSFGDLVYTTVIPRNIRLSEAPSHGKPVLIYDEKCIGSVSYMMLVKEILHKIGMKI